MMGRLNGTGAKSDCMISEHQKISRKKDNLERLLEASTNRENYLQERITELEEMSKSSEETSKVFDESCKELLNNQFKCSICQEIYALSTTLNCGHTFCNECISTWTET